MEITRYTYQSPHASPVQFGKPDSGSQKNQNGDEQQLPNATNETLAKAQEFQASQTQEVKPSVETNSLQANTLDLYV